MKSTKSDLFTTDDCQHAYSLLWLADPLRYVRRCRHCQHSELVRDETELRQSLQGLLTTKLEYQQHRDRQKSAAKKRESAAAVDRVQAQVDYVNQVLQEIEVNAAPTLCPDGTSALASFPGGNLPEATAASGDSGALDVPSSEQSLSPDEERDRHRLEVKVERAFYEAGVALRELRDRRLYRSTHRSFEEYCHDRFGFERRHPYRLIEAATVIENLCPTETQNEEVSKLCPNGTQIEMTKHTQILPTSERQVRPLTKLEPEKQVEAWNSAVEAAGGKVPSSAVVQDVVERMVDKPNLKPQDLVNPPKSKHKQLLPSMERNLDVPPEELPPTPASLVNVAALNRGKPEQARAEWVVGFMSQIGDLTASQKEAIGDRLLEYLSQDQLEAIAKKALGQLSCDRYYQAVKNLDSIDCRAMIKANKQVLNERHHPEYFKGESA